MQQKREIQIASPFYLFIKKLLFPNLGFHFITIVLFVVFVKRIMNFLFKAAGMSK